MRTAYLVLASFCALAGFSRAAHAGDCDAAYVDYGVCYHSPDIMGVTPESDSSIRISWLPATTYAAEVRIIRGGSVVAHAHDNPGGNNYFDDQGLAAGTYYGYQICNVYNAGRELTYCVSYGGTTLAKQGPPPPQTPTAPARIVVTSAGYASAHVNWTNPTTGPARTSYKLTRDASAHTPAITYLLTSTADNFMDWGLSPMDTYVYHLCAWNAAGSSSTCPTGSVRLPAPPPAPMPLPPAPTAVRAELTGASPPFEQFKISWSQADSGLVSYFVVQRKGVAPTTDAAWADASDLLPNSTTSTGVNALATGQLYSFRVCAYPGTVCSASVIQNAGAPVGNITIPPAVDNLMMDSGFEAQDDRAAVGQPWTLEGDTGKGIDIGLGYAHSGLNNGFMRSASGWNAFVQSVGVQPNTSYTLTAWVHTSDNVHDGYFGVRRGSNGAVYQEIKYGPSVAGYTQLTVSFYSGSETSLSVYCGYWAPNADSWVQMDDFALVAKPSTVVLAPGGFAKP